jgi:hypothetical protein
MMIITYATLRSHVVNSTLKLLMRCCLCISIMIHCFILCTHNVFNESITQIEILMRTINIF